MIDWTQIPPPVSPDAEVRPVPEEVLRKALGARLGAVHRPTGVSAHKLAAAMGGLGFGHAEVFAEAIVEEDRGLAHFVGPLLEIASDARAPDAYRGLAAAALSYLETPEAVPVLSELVRHEAISPIAARGLLALRSEEAFGALLGALNKAQGWAKADVIEALLAVDDPDLDEMILVESVQNMGPALGRVAYAVANRVGLDRALAGELSEPARTAALELLVELLQQDMTGRPAAPRPPIMVGELVEAMLDGLADRRPGFREARVATIVLASGESPTLDDSLHDLLKSVDVVAEVHAALKAGQYPTAVGLARTFRSHAAAAVLFDELVANEKADPTARAWALKTGAELGEPRVLAVVRAALEHHDLGLRAAALDASRYLTAALGTDAIVKAARSAMATRERLLCRAAVELARLAPHPELVRPLEVIADVFDPKDRGSLDALEAALQLCRAAGSVPN